MSDDRLRELVTTRCKAEEWQRDGRGLWSMRACVRDAGHGASHVFGVWRYNVTADELADALAERPEGETIWTVHPPMDQRVGRPPIETHGPCLYMRVRSCLEEFPGSPDNWCGYCSGTHKAIKRARGPQ